MATPAKGQILHALGIAFQGNITGFIVESITYGMFIYLFFESTLIFIRRGLRTLPPRVMFMTSLVTLLLEGIHVVTFIIGLFRFIAAVLLGDLATLGDPSWVATFQNQVVPLQIGQNWVDQLLIYISDGIVIWRAWVLFSEQKRMMILPITLWVGSIATGLGYLAEINDIANLSAIESKQPIPTLKLITAHLALSFITNVVATLLIAYRLLAHQNLGSTKAFRLTSQSAAQNVLVLLVESGIVYCAVQLVRMVLYCIPSSANRQSPQFYITLVITSLASSATAMYPTVVIMFVNQQRTLTERFGIGNDDKLGRPPTGDAEYRAATPGHISFVSPRTETTTHNESLALNLSNLSVTNSGVVASGDTEKSLFVGETLAGQQTKSAPF